MKYKPLGRFIAVRMWSSLEFTVSCFQIKSPRKNWKIRRKRINTRRKKAKTIRTRKKLVLKKRKRTRTRNEK